MKLILNNKNNENIAITNFNRNLDIDNPTILFNIYFSTDNLADITSMNYLAQYANTKITAYKILNNDDDVLLEVNDINAKLTSFNETFTNDYYNANASIQIMENTNIQPMEEEE